MGDDDHVLAFLFGVMAYDRKVWPFSAENSARAFSVTLGWPEFTLFQSVITLG